jgi:hypothetical protein
MVVGNSETIVTKAKIEVKENVVTIRHQSNMPGMYIPYWTTLRFLMHSFHLWLPCSPWLPYGGGGEGGVNGRLGQKGRCV